MNCHKYPVKTAFRLTTTIHNVLVEIFMMVTVNTIHNLPLWNIQWALIVDLTVVKKSMTASKAGEDPDNAPNSDSSTRSRSSWSPVIYKCSQM